MSSPRLIIIDADTVAGWRRERPSFLQLLSAVGDIATAHPSDIVTIIGDPALKWALPPDDQQPFDSAINNNRMVVAPAGTRSGHRGFIQAAVQRAADLHLAPVVVSDQIIPNCDVAPLRRVGTTFQIDMDNPLTFDDDDSRIRQHPRPRRNTTTRNGSQSSR